MPRPSFSVFLVVLLLGVIFLREPVCQRWEENFLRWLLENSSPETAVVPLTVVEIGHDPSEPKKQRSTDLVFADAGKTVSPLEYALLLQSALEFKPTVVAIENVVRWRERDQDQEQIFLDQAMRVPKLLLAAELSSTPDPDAAVSEIPVFTQVKGKRGGLPSFSGQGRQPNEDIRLISTPGFINLPEESADDIHVPLLFQYRGEVVPSFALEAVLLWLRLTPAEVPVVIGSHIQLPGNRRIPIRSDGTVLINPSALKKARRINLNELLLAAQQRGKKDPALPNLTNLKDHIVLARTPANPLSPTDVFAATIATIQSNTYIRRVSVIFDFLVLLLIAAVGGLLRKVTRGTLILAAIAFSAAYCLMALAVIARWSIWVPGYLPLGAVWLIVLIHCFGPRPRVPAPAPAPVTTPSESD